MEKSPLRSDFTRISTRLTDYWSILNKKKKDWDTMSTFNLKMPLFGLDMGSTLCCTSGPINFALGFLIIYFCMD